MTLHYNPKGKITPCYKTQCYEMGEDLPFGAVRFGVVVTCKIAQLWNSVIFLKLKTKYEIKKQTHCTRVSSM